MKIMTKHACFIEVVAHYNKTKKVLYANYTNCVPELGDKLRLDKDSKGFRVQEVRYDGMKNDTKIFTINVKEFDAQNNTPKKLISNMRTELLALENMF